MTTVYDIYSFIEDLAPYRKEGNLKDFCFCDITQYGALMVTKSFESPSVLLDYFYAERDSLSRIKQKANDLFKTSYKHR